jgi:hypothetical protein
MNKNLSINENTGPQGMIRIKQYRAGTLDKALVALAHARLFAKKATDHTGLVKEKLLAWQKESMQEFDAIMAEGFIATAVECPNLIMQGNLTGKDLLVQYLCGAGLVGATIYGGINYGAIGTGTATPTIADTQLQTETLRVAIANAIDNGNSIAQLQFFFTDALLANGAYKEVGTFMNGSGTANSGAIFNRSLLGTTYNKTTGVDTTLEVDITLT